MRDICILRGHEKPVSSLTWHPVHSSLISTGSEDGSLYHYLLDEPNLPPGHVPTVAPYDSNDPLNTPPQVIYPAHRIQYAHSATIWSLHWHPLGHILASGSKDNFTRFWSRARPGETAYMKDRFHIGEEAAEAQGTWNRGFGKKQMREEEEQELQDEADGLVDQRKAAAPALPGIQGLPGISADGGPPGLLPGIGNPQPPPQPNMALAPNQLASLLGGSSMPAVSHGNYTPPQNTGLPGFGFGHQATATPPPVPQANLNPNLNLAALQKQLLAQGVELPANFANPSAWNRG